MQGHARPRPHRRRRGAQAPPALPPPAAAAAQAPPAANDAGGASHGDADRRAASGRHPVSGSPAAGLLLRRLGDVAARSDSRVHECAEVHRYADDAGRSGRDHGVPGRRGLGEDRLHRQQERAPGSHSDPDLRRRPEQRRHRGPSRRDGVRPERRRVQHLQHRSSARRAADGGLDAASAAGAEDAALLRERHAPQRLRQSGAASRDGERRASAPTSR